MIKHYRRVADTKAFLPICIAMAASFLVTCSQPQPIQAPYDWKSDWAVESGFSITPDTAGYSFPTAIAFVPNPGPAPKDPLYFVTEIRGTVKVVTNDRTVYTFASGFEHMDVTVIPPEPRGDLGTAGICLEPKRGYVFVTFLSQDVPGGVYRNRIIRFETKPGTFSIQPIATTIFSDAFAADGLIATGHQIGPCQVDNDLLYVGIGDSDQVVRSQQPDSLVGKIIRMTLDGLPAPGNPLYKDDDPRKPQNYIWASGFRNPFGLKIVSGRVFVADNGDKIDRFVEVEKGQNYLWDGGDWSIGTNANFIFSPSVGVVQMDYIAGGTSKFPSAFDQHFFVASSTHESGKKAGIVTLPFDLSKGELRGTPQLFLQYQGDMLQAVTGLAFGPDGLYFAPVLADENGTSAILKITYDRQHPHPFTLENDLDATSLMYVKGCTGCHSFNHSLGGEAPNLDGSGLIPRLQSRLQSDSYRQSALALDALDEEPFRSFRGARQQVLKTAGLDQVQIWIKFHLIEPRFDNRYAQMPNPGLTDVEAARISDFLLADYRKSTGLEALWWQTFVPALNAHLFLYGLVSFIVGGFLFSLANLGFRKIRSRR
jgi:glucose/arabinose dehydrogenase